MFFDEGIKLEELKERIYLATADKLSMLFARFTSMRAGDAKEIRSWLEDSINLLKMLDELPKSIDNEIKKLALFNDKHANEIISELDREKQGIFFILKIKSSLDALRKTKEFTEAHLDTIRQCIQMITARLRELEELSKVNAEIMKNEARVQAHIRKAA